MTDSDRKLSQKEYLKKYLSGGKQDKKNKKKIKTSAKPTVPRTKIIDDDVDLSKLQPIDESALDLYELNEEAPQIVGVIDERPAEVQALDQYKQSQRWKVLNDPDGDGLKVSALGKLKGRSFDHDDDNVFNVTPKTEELSDEDELNIIPKQQLAKQKQAEILLGRKLKSEKVDDPSFKHYDSDASPPRRKHNNDSDNSPPRKKRHDSDTSPPRRKRHNDSDTSPPRRKRHNDSDTSPPRRKNHGDSDTSPPRRKRHDSNASPPRRKRHDDTDASPLRRKRHDDTDASPPRRKRHDDSDASPPRKKKQDDDASPPRRKRYDLDGSLPQRGDASPGRRKPHLDTDSSPPRRKRQGKTDASPPRRKRDQDGQKRFSRFDSPPPKIKEEKPDDYPSNSKMVKTLDGKVAGLQDAKKLKRELMEVRRREEDVFAKMDDSVSGRGASAVQRDRKTGLKRDLERERAEQEAEDAEKNKHKQKYDRWGKGLKQTEDQQERLARDMHEMSKPLARYADDNDLESHLKNQEREGDPMLEYLRSKKKEDPSSGKGKPVYQGSFPPNRYNIRPGYRWDGVDRSCGYENKWFENINARKAVQEEAMKWSMEDM